MMRFMQWLHRWVSLILIIQVVLWLISATVFSIMGHHGMSGHQYMRHIHPEMLADESPQWSIQQVRATHAQADTILLTNVLGHPQYQVNVSGEWLYLDGHTGQPWQTDVNLAQALALASYDGPGHIAEVEQVTGAAEVVDWSAAGYRVQFADDLNTRVYVDAASGQIVEHRNTPWTIADWAFRLHFMDYSGERSFNHLLIWSAGLFALWFSLSGLILLIRNISQGDFNPRRKPTWLEQLQREEKPIASSCGGGGTCGLCKVTFTSSELPTPTAAEKVMLSDAELAGGLRLACQHKVQSTDTVKLANENVASHLLTLHSKRDLTPSIAELTFTSTRRLDYQAGQFLQFKIPHESTVLERHYSLATAPNNDDKLVFTVRHMPAPKSGVPAGVGSSFLCRLQSGDHVEAIGPFGDFLLTEASSRQQVFIGGGAGIAPLRALVQAEQQSATPRAAMFFYGARNSAELCYTEEFEQNPNVTYVPVLSAAPEKDQWTGQTGFVHEVAEAWLREQDTQQVDVYVCGPPLMLEATMKMLAELGVPRDHIKFDDFGI
ncbi:FAD-binding oxidoreductase [Pseudidiomarina sp. CB1]|uniref:FAD-binding oxidoreductase n=1 Tax=Pseudidiomarina sp. CB1 TaxID=2972484 RepID=UPI002161180C|nr:FAD-binding oxidoreductase [Pseudidiomarina sp. CB1]